MYNNNFVKNTFHYFGTHLIFSENHDFSGQKFIYSKKIFIKKIKFDENHDFLGTPDFSPKIVQIFASIFKYYDTAVSP